jgi:hypothetical protein
MASGYTVSALTDYVKVNQDVLIKNVVLGEVKGDTLPKLRKQFGVKTKERLNYLDVDPSIQDGSSCGFNASGSTTFSERDIETAQLKAQDQYCDKDLLGKYAEYLVKINAQKDASDMPFEREIVDEVVGKINEKMEKLVWQGATSANSGTDLIDGFLTQALNADSASTVNVTIATGTTVYEAIKSVVMAIPERILDKATIFVSPALYRSFVMEMVEKNFIHFGPDGSMEDRDITFLAQTLRYTRPSVLLVTRNTSTHQFTRTWFTVLTLKVTTRKLDSGTMTIQSCSNTQSTGIAV